MKQEVKKQEVKKQDDVVLMRIAKALEKLVELQEKKMKDAGLI